MASITERASPSVDALRVYRSSERSRNSWKSWAPRCTAVLSARLGMELMRPARRASMCLGLFAWGASSANSRGAGDDFLIRKAALRWYRR